MAQTASDVKDVEGKLSTTVSPHVRSPRTVQWVMTQVLIALVPPTLAAIYFFGWWVIVQMAVAILTAVLSEYAYQKYKYQPVTIKDRSAMVTGALVGLSFPVVAPLWLIIFASAFAIVIVKQWNGGLGRNYLNPAVTARVVSKALFTPFFANWILPNGLFAGPYGGVDAITVSTPLEYLGNGAQTVSAQVPTLWELFLGANLGGNIGETSKLAILIGLLYLIFRKIINPKVPIYFMLTAVLVAGFWSGFNLEFMLSHLLSGTLVFGAVYMATDYSSGSLTPQGKTVFAVGGGLITMFFRHLFGYPGGFGFSIIIMNILAPYIDNKLMPRIYGHKSRPDVWFNRQGLNRPKNPR